MLPMHYIYGHAIMYIVQAGVLVACLNRVHRGWTGPYLTRKGWTATSIGPWREEFLVETISQARLR